MVAWLAKAFENATLTEVGLWFRRDVGTMSAGLRRIVQRAARASEIKEGTGKLQGELRKKLDNLEA
jgi:hypothetical protein